MIAMLEVSLFGVMGQLVDWLSTHGPENFLNDESAKLIGLSVLILVGIPLLVLLHSLIMHQTLLGKSIGIGIGIGIINILFLNI